MDTAVKSLLLRFIRAFIAGAVSTMVTTLTFTGNWNDLNAWLSSLALGGIVGGISGLLMAIDKYLRMPE